MFFQNDIKCTFEADMKIITEVSVDKLISQINWEDKIFMIGSCFADEVGTLLKSYGLDCCTNPFGTQYNVLSIFNSLKRLAKAINFLPDSDESSVSTEGYPFFTEQDVFQRPDSLYVTFFHHSRCGNIDKNLFLKSANKELIESAEKLKSAKFLIITLGSSFVYLKSATGSDSVFNSLPCSNVVSNCHKLPAKEFVKRYVHTAQCAETLQEIVDLFPDKKIIFTVSPIRHLGEGAHLNQISKSTLLLAIQRVMYGASYGGNLLNENLFYFPSYEIFMDELRDYRWVGEDLSHPTPAAVKYIFEKFKEACIDPSAYAAMTKAFKENQFLNHKLLKDKK